MPPIAEAAPRAHAGFIIQLVRSNDVQNVRRLLECADDTGIECYIRESCNGMGVLHWAASHQSAEMMHCLVSRIEDCHHISDDFQQILVRPAYRVLGFPLIRHYSFKTPLQIAVQNDNPNVIRQIMGMVEVWEVSDDFLLHTDPEGYTAIQSAAAKRVDTINSILEYMEPPRAVRLLAHQGAHGWSSLHVSSIKGNQAMMNCILGYFDNEERIKFITERDREGWTSLHWTAARGNAEATEALMNQISVQAREHLCGVTDANQSERPWTVVHACARSRTDSHKTLANIMARFDRESQWKILQCPSVDGKTALHVAVEENNAQAVLMLIDHAGDNLQELLSQQDDLYLTAEDYATPNTELAEYLKVSSKFGKLALHHAALTDDENAILWILENNASSNYDLVNSIRNNDGYSALHVASQHNSASAISALLQSLNDNQLVFESISNRTADSDENNSLHIAAQNNSLSALNELLFSINREQRKEILESENAHGMNVSHLPEKNIAVNSLLAGHEQFCDGNIHDLFTHDDYAFHFDNDEAIEKAYVHIEPRLERIPGFVCHANIDAMTCIKKDDHVRAIKLIEEAFAIDPDNIHTWMNVGAVLLDLAESDTQQRALEEAALKLLNLKASKSALITAKMEYAYWLAETGRRDEHRKECCILMEQCLQTDIPEADGTNNLELNCRTLYMKVIIRWLKDMKMQNHKPSKSRLWRQEKVQRAVDQLIYLSHESISDFYHREMLIWLIEIQRKKIWDHCEEALNDELCRFRETTGRTTDVEDCIQQVIQYVDAYPDDYRFKVRLAYNCLEVAYKQEHDINKRKMWLAKALKYSTEGNTEEGWIFMSASTIAAAQLHIWAIGYYDRHKEFLDRLIIRRYNIRGEVSLSNGWRYLNSEFYSSKPENHKGGNNCLKKIAQQHEAIIKRHRKQGYLTHGLKYARVLCLLGKPVDDVLKVFHTYISFVEAGADEELVRALQHRGHYLKVMGRITDAERDLRKAVELCDKSQLNKNLVALARCDLEHIVKLKNSNHINRPNHENNTGCGRVKACMHTSHGRREAWGSETQHHATYDTKKAYHFTGDQRRWNKGRGDSATSTQRQQHREQRQQHREQRDQQRWSRGRYGSSSSSWKQEPVGSWRQQPSGERN